MFDRVKSRSAHLKWHGGSYKEDGSSGTSQPAKKKDKDKDRVPQFLFRSGDVVKLNAVGAAKFGSFGAKSVGKVEADGKLDTAVGEICYKVLFRSKGRNRMIIAANSHLRMARREEKMREAASNHVYAAGDTVLAKRPGNASGALVRGQIVSVNSELEDDVLYSFQSKGETDSVPLRAQHLHADTEITVQDLKVGDAVCANQVSKTPDVYQIGAVTQILQQRVKINFANKTPTVWRKITDVRLV